MSKIIQQVEALIQPVLTDLNYELVDVEFTKEGKDYIEFMIRTNKGEEQKELKKIASGGEMSRIMLSIKNILRRSR